MAKYKVELAWFETVEVEAASTEEAEDKALAETTLCGREANEVTGYCELVEAEAA